LTIASVIRLYPAAARIRAACAGVSAVILGVESSVMPPPFAPTA